ncbi:MAG: nucleotide exchange factor GrpE [Anaerolineae bacterium]|nr:nucleotide exchange factor GrpE [Anaerolineae bacterium]
MKLVDKKAKKESEKVTETPESVAPMPEVPEAVETAEVTEAPLEAEVARLTEALAEAEALAAQHLDAWQRSQAAYQNYRKRMDAERIEWQANANAQLLTRLLAVMDDFERAFDRRPEELQEHSWTRGIELVKQKLQHVFDVENVKPIEITPGQEFDPYYHEAISCQECPGFGDNQIIGEAARGYMQGERVLRPSQVIVAKAPTVGTIVEGTAVEVPTPAEGPSAEAASPEAAPETSGD